MDPPEEVYNRIMRKLQRQANYDATKTLGIAGASSGVGQNLEASLVGGNASVVGPGSLGGTGTIGGGSSVDGQKDDLQLTTEERRFGSTPVAGTLRVLIDHVRDTVNEKLTMANLTNVKECMRELYESRALLDKLLKEVPQHTPFRDSKTLATSLQDLFQEFRKIPVLLPIAKYDAQQDHGGRRRPELHQRATNVNQAQMSTSFQHASNSFHGSDLASMSMIAPQPPTQPRAAPSAPPIGAVGGLAVPGMVARGAVRMQHNAGNPIAGLLSKDHAVVMKHLRRQTQLIDNSCQTEETIAQTVPKEEYEHSLRRIKQVEGIVTDYETVVSRLSDQLETARGAIMARQQTIKYVRETLYKECCVLRQQLAVANSRNQRSMRSSQRSPNPAAASVSQNVDMAASALDSTIADITKVPSLSFNQGPGGVTGVDITSVHSLLDLVLLAVERDKQIDEETGELVPGPKEEMGKLKDELHARTMRYKREQTALRLKFNMVMTEKNKQLQAMKVSTDTVRMRRALAQVAMQLKDDYQTMRHQIKELFTVMSGNMFNIVSEVEFAAKQASHELQDLRQQRATQLAVLEVIKAAEGLFVPMLRPEFAQGCHTWEHSRQSEPLRSFVAQRYGGDMVHKVAPELYSLQQVYINLQRFTLQMFQQPDMGRPAPGMMLNRLGQRMLAAEDCTPSTSEAIKKFMKEDTRLALEIAKLNFSLKLLTLRQHLIQERSKTALKQAGFDPNAMSLPVQHRVNVLAQEVTARRQTKGGLVAERLANARSLWQIWKETKIDIHYGRNPVHTKDPASLWMPQMPSVAQRAAARGGAKGPGATLSPTTSPYQGSL